MASQDEQISTSQNNEFTFVTSKRGTQVLLHEGYQYNKKRDNKKGTSVWRCATRLCHGIIITLDNQILKQLPHDMCLVNFASNEIRKKVDICKKQASCLEGDPIPSLYKKTLTLVKDSGIDIIQKFPSFTSMKTSLYNARNKEHGVKRTL